MILKYSISKIKNIIKLDDYFEKDENFNLKEYCKKSFGVYDDKQLNVKLLFDNSVKEDVLNYHFHPTQKILETKNGVIVEFCASGMREICWNLYKWEDKVKILEPVELFEFYKDNLNKILEIYK